jgi:hypothetical protein
MHLTLYCCTLCLLFATLVYCDVYNVQFNNNGGSGKCHHKGKHIGHGDNDKDPDWTEYIVAINSDESERDLAEPHLVGFHYELFTAVAKAGKCKITLVHDIQSQCIQWAEEESEIDFAPGGELQLQNYDGCANIRVPDALNWIGHTSDTYLTAEAGYAFVTGEILSKASKIAFIEEDELEPVIADLLRSVYYNDETTLYKTLELAADDLKTAKVDAVFVSHDTYSKLSTLVPNLAITKTQLPPFGIFADKRSSGLIECFNDGLSSIVKSGEFQKICEDNKDYLKDNELTCEYGSDEVDAKGLVSK